MPVGCSVGVGPVQGQFEKAALKLHCVYCGDTMFTMDPGLHICIACNVRQEIMVRFGENISQELEDEILPEEIHIIIYFPDIGTQLLNEVAGRFIK